MEAKFGLGGKKIKNNLSSDWKEGFPRSVVTAFSLEVFHLDAMRKSKNELSRAKGSQMPV